MTELRAWLKEENPNADPSRDDGYRVRFRYLGPETEAGDAEAEEGEAGAETEEGAEGVASAVPAKAIPPDLMKWVESKDWRLMHLNLLAAGVWRNADDMSAEIDIDSATTRRRMGDLRKRGLVTSHRHHGYRITPEGQGALAHMVDESEGAAGTSAADWLAAKKGRGDIIEVLKDGRWHNAAEIGEFMGLSVVSVQRRVAALRDRGLVESHRRRGYRLTDVGFEAIGMSPEEAKASMAPRPMVHGGGTDAMSDIEATFATEERLTAPEAFPSDLLEWLDRQPYRKDLLVAIPHDDYISASELSEILGETVTTLHGRLATLRDRKLVESIPRQGYTLTPLGTQAVEVIKTLSMRRGDEPLGASAFLSAESDSWSIGGASEVGAPAAGATVPVAKPRRQLAAGDTCGFCQTTTMGTPEAGWIEAMQDNLETPTTAGKGETVPCRRGILEDGAWFLVVDRDPIAEGHCKLVCKEHVHDLLELAEWSHRDQRMAHIRDTLARDLMLAIEVISSLDQRIVDVMVFSSMEHGAHLHFDLVPRYRMDLPGLRPVASSRAYYDDLSLTKKRKLWKARRLHLEEVAAKLRESAHRILTARSAPGVVVT
nr:HTH domain-containing protein [Thermoplasmata archaeon]NIS13823.1 HTH domain-containing protein [Thermoplasmata archaeon]NIS21670.1 HTH domain-containing protein [Thermoplasmata archaeon]NIT79265.1 HTH domain-containing protein [Thermoplasmata archaeon]NIU50702.1 HTH domain-containing protein [Thermoplasmata archaeon]